LGACCNFEQAEDGRRVAVVSGELDADAVAVVAASLLTGGAPDVLDTSGVAFLSAAGVSLLLRAAGDRRLDVIAGPTVARLIELCGLEERLRVVEAEGGAAT